MRVPINETDLTIDDLIMELSVEEIHELIDRGIITREEVNDFYRNTQWDETP